MNTKSDDVAVKQAYDKWANDRDVLTNRTRMLIFGCALAALWGGLIDPFPPEYVLSPVSFFVVT